MTKELQEAQDTIKKQQGTIRGLKACLRVCFFGWLITLLSVAAIFYTGKIPPFELNISTPNFGSIYSDNVWELNNGF